MTKAASPYKAVIVLSHTFALVGDPYIVLLYSAAEKLQPLKPLAKLSYANSR